MAPPPASRHMRTASLTFIDVYRLNSREYLLYAVALLHILLCPFTKVEESFHLQATHDIVVYGPFDVAAFDHLEYPGVVPRTFIGALLLAAVSWPWKFVLHYLGMPKIALQIVVRCLLAGAVCFSYGRLIDAVALRLGHRTARAMSYVVVLTPHFLFYAGRTLPNTFALLLVINGITQWMYMDLTASAAEKRKWFPTHLFRAVACFVAAVLWLRCDMLVLLGPVALCWLMTGRASVGQLIVNGATVGVVALATTVLVDSYFWQRWLWPEGTVLWYNTVENRSHEYGVSAFHWYFTDAIPRALLAMLVFIPPGILTLLPVAASIKLGSTGAVNKPSGESGASGTGVATATNSTSRSLPKLPHLDTNLEDFFWRKYPRHTLQQLFSRLRLDWEILSFLLPGVAFVALYSLLPHKELRFILPAMPLFHIAAARGLTKIYRIGEALFWGIHAVKPGPEVAAAEFFSDAVETAVSNKVPALSRFVGTPTAELRRRHTKFGGGPVDALRRGNRSPSPDSRREANYQSVGRLAPSDPLLAMVRGLSHSNLNNHHAKPSTSAAAEASANEQPDVTASPPLEEDSHAPSRASLSLCRRALGTLALCLVVGALGTNLLLTSVYVRVSMNNYPGGEALQRLYTVYAHEIRGRNGALTAASSNKQRASLIPTLPFGTLPPCPEGDVTTYGVFEWWRQCVDAKLGCPTALLPSDKGHLGPNAACALPDDPRLERLRVHIDTKAAETGVSRFGQSWSNAWVYSKDETLKEPEEFTIFNFLLTENATHHTRFFDVVETISSFTSFNWNGFAVRRSPSLFIMRRRKA